MITTVPPSRESISLAGTLTARELAKERVDAVVPKSVGFPLMAKETCSRRELGVVALSPVGKAATIRPQVGIQVFAVLDVLEHVSTLRYGQTLLVDALLLCRWVAAFLVSICSRVWAVVLSICLDLGLIVCVTPGFGNVGGFISSRPGVNNVPLRFWAIVPLGSGSDRSWLDRGLWADAVDAI